MDEEIADGHLARDVGVRHLEPGQVVDHRRVPPYLPFVDQDPERRRGEHLRVRRNAEEGARIHGLGRAQRSHSVTPGHDGPAVLDDCQGQSGNLERRHRPLDPAVQILRRLLSRKRRGQQ